MKFSLSLFATVMVWSGAEAAVLGQGGHGIYKGGLLGANGHGIYKGGQADAKDEGEAKEDGGAGPKETLLEIPLGFVAAPMLRTAR